MMAGAHDMREAQRRHIIDRRLARSHHHRDDRCNHPGIGGEGLRRPFARYSLGGQVRVPRHATERIPVRLVEDRPAPVAVDADIGDPGDAGQLVAFQRSVDHLGDGRSLAPGQRIALQRLLEQRAQIGKVGRLAQIFLGDLEFHHQRRLGHRAEQRVEGFARLEVDRAILHLDDDIVGELAVERLEVAIGLLGAIVGIVMGIDEGAPHHDAAMRLDRSRQHVGAVGMGALIILRAGLALAVRLHQEAAEIGDRLVDFVGLGLPPGGNRRVERIGAFQAIQFHRRSPFDRQIDLDAIGAEQVGQRRRLGDIGRGQAVRLGIHIVEHRAVDAQRRVGAGIVGIARPLIIGQAPPIPDRLAGIAALHRAIQIVPMVEQAQADARRAAHIDPVERRAGAGKAQPGIGAVQHADIGRAGNHRHRLARDRHGANRITVRPQAVGRHRWLVLLRGRLQQDRTLLHCCCQGHGGAGQPGYAALQFLPCDRQGRAGPADNAARVGPNLLGSGWIGRHVAQPQIIAILGPGAWRADQKGAGHDPAK